MKIEREKVVGAFNPVTLKITIETKEELYSLYQRLIPTGNDIELNLKKPDTIFDKNEKFFNVGNLDLDSFNEEICSILSEKQELGEI